MHYTGNKITASTACVVNYKLETGTNSTTGKSDRVGTTNDIIVPHKQQFRLIYFYIVLAFYHSVYITDVFESGQVDLVFNKN